MVEIPEGGGGLGREQRCQARSEEYMHLVTASQIYRAESGGAEGLNEFRDKSLKKVGFMACYS